MQSSKLKIILGLLIVVIGTGLLYSLKGKDLYDKPIDEISVTKNHIQTARDPGVNPSAATPWRPTQDIFEQYEVPVEISESVFYTKGDREVRFDMWQGRKLIVNLWATWCAPCVAELPSLDRLKGKIDKTGYDVIAVSVDRRKSIQDIDAFLNKLNVKNLVTFFDKDRDLIRKTSFSALPVTLILDEQGREIARHSGPLEWDDPKVIEALSKL